MENNNVDTTKTINHLSLCSGYEGIGLGLRRVLPNLREIAYVEREGFPVANLVAKMEAGELDAAPVFTDVKTFPYGEFRGCVDILSGGFPCQPFSAAGKRNGVEDPRHLFPYIADGIRECQPRIVFLENVEGIISAKTADGESVLQYVLRELEGLGYRATAGVFSAAEVGAPHQRKRVFILGLADTRNRTGGRTMNGTAKGSARARSNNLERSDEMHRDSGEAGQPHEQATQACSLTGQDTSGGSGYTMAARPSEPQHEWEEPRVTGQAEPRLGGKSNGPSNRVDRLRLLGNGVVPATAAKAFVTLINRIYKHD